MSRGLGFETVSCNLVSCLGIFFGPLTELQGEEIPKESMFFLLGLQDSGNLFK